MPRRNPDQAKELIQRHTKEILRYGDEGKAELRELFVGAQRPDVILSLPQGPDRSARAAALIGSLREILQELSEGKAVRELQSGKKASKKPEEQKATEPKKKPSDIIWRTHGNIDRFNYTINKRRDGYFVAKITKKGRNVIEDDKAPRIYDNPLLDKHFSSHDDAELAVRRVINTAMIWYAERGIRVRERKRRSEKSRGTMRRRTAAMREEISKEEAETRRIAAKKKAAQERKERIRKEKMEGTYRRRRSNPEKSLRHIPRGNPSKFFSFKHSETSAEKQAAKSYSSYLSYREKWDESLRSGKPRFITVMKAYDALENTRANLMLAGQKERADAVDRLRVDLRQQLIDIFSTCSRYLSKMGKEEEFSEPKVTQMNPGPDTHVKIANELLEKAKSEMAKYKESGSIPRLLNAYSNYEMAKREFRYAKHKTGLKKATAGAKRSREELKKKARG
jgi:hypothetical protein